MKTKEEKTSNTGKILLVLCPFWTPMIPPIGISRIKAFIGKYGYMVKTVDLNLESELTILYDNYFDTLKKFIPDNRRGNFYNIGNDVWRDHMMAHINFKEERKYIDLVRQLVYNSFYFELDDDKIHQLNRIFAIYYSKLNKHLLYLLELEKPGILGVSVFRDTLASSIYAFKVTRENYPHIKTVMGGGIFSQQLIPGSPNFELFLEKTEAYIDKLFLGPGEQLFLEYLQGNLPGSKRWYSSKDLKVKALDFASLDKPDISDFDSKNYYYSAAQASSSCPYNCTFCNVPSFYGKYKTKEARQVVEEMIASYKQYRTQLFFMLDSMLNPNLSTLANEIIQNGVMLYYDGYLRVDESTCDDRNTLLWRRGGFYRARIGVETGSQVMLDLMKKKIKVEQTRATIFNLANAGIKTTAYVLIGHPGETEEDFQQTLDFVEEMKNYIWEVECNPFNYFYSGQNLDEWRDKRILLYPEDAKDMLISQTWILDCNPSREEMYKRVNRFVEHCNKLGIPNPYSMLEINRADKRWGELHKNAVPPLVELINRGSYVDDSKKVKHFLTARNDISENSDFDF